MKKYFYLAAAAIALVACNNEKLENGSVQELKSISLTASINSSVDATRAKSADALQNEAFVVGKQIKVVHAFSVFPGNFFFRNSP